MCTALSLNNKKKYLFGRNMDIENPFHQNIVITPREYVWDMRFQKPMKQTYAMIGMAFPYKDVENNNKDYPLYAEGANEHGLAAAGLNFPVTAYYPEPGTIEGAFELTPYELIPWVLANFKTTDEVEDFLSKNNLRLVNKPISSFIPCAELHFIIADKNDKSIVLEPCRDGLKVHKNILGILTNNPVFDWQIINLSFYQSLSPRQQENVEWSNQNINPLGRGFGAHGIPGDWTPASRFVRTAYLKSITSTDLKDDELLSQFFHILDNVAVPNDTILVQDPNKGTISDITLYSCCVDLNTSTYYYKTFYNNQLTAFELHNENLDSNQIIVYPFSSQQEIKFANRK
ncbi:MAG: choloylglycine hydrolase [Ureaplasma sp.]|nr:choloylglycine hydrolase [Ureaplasma sp.]